MLCGAALSGSEKENDPRSDGISKDQPRIGKTPRADEDVSPLFETFIRSCAQYSVLMHMHVKTRDDKGPVASSHTHCGGL